MKKNLKILYVARTHRQHDRVIDELRMIYKQRPVTGVSIRGRNEMCLNVFAAKGAFDSKSLMEVCELLKSKGRCPYYKNVENRTYDYLQLQQQVASQTLHGLRNPACLQEKGDLPLRTRQRRSARRTSHRVQLPLRF